MPCPTAMVVTLCSQVRAALPRLITMSPTAAASKRSSGASCESRGMPGLLPPGTSAMPSGRGHGFDIAKPATRTIWVIAQRTRHLYGRRDGSSFQRRLFMSVRLHRRQMLSLRGGIDDEMHHPPELDRAIGDE